MKRFLSLLTLLLLAAPVQAQTVTTPAVAALVCANNTVVPTPVAGQFFYVQCDSNGKLITSGGGSSLLASNNTWTGTNTFDKTVGVSGASFGLSGNISAAAWTTNGVRYKNAAATLTDTSSSGTVAAAYTDLWGGNTIATTNSTTFTNYYGAYFKAPVAAGGGKPTITNTYALGADSLQVGAGTQAAPSLQFAGLTGASGFYVASSSQLRLAFNNTSVVSIFNDGSLQIISDTSQLRLGLAGDVLLTRGGAAAILQLGAQNAASPVAQTLQAQGSRSGTDSNVAGASLTIQPGAGTGTAAPGALVFNSYLPTTTGSGAQTKTLTLTLNRGSTIAGPGVALSTSATDGFIYIPGGAGPPTGVPTAQTGTVAMYYDVTNNQLYAYNGGWLQPKTPAAAAIVTWQ